MHRVLISPRAVRGDQVVITDPSTCHHLRDVLRLTPGDRLDCFDGAGRTYRGPILRCASREVIVRVEERVEEAVPTVRVILAAALIKPERFEWLLQKVTELGVAEVLPLVTDRTVSKPSGASARLERWRRIVREAAAQCGRATVPVVHEPRRFSEFVETLDHRPAFVLTLADAGQPLRECARQLAGATEAVVIIGPEGDLAVEEIALAKRHGARTVRLGRLTLRSETAAIAAVTIVQEAFGTL